MTFYEAFTGELDKFAKKKKKKDKGIDLGRHLITGGKIGAGVGTAGGIARVPGNYKLMRILGAGKKGAGATAAAGVLQGALGGTAGGGLIGGGVYGLRRLLGAKKKK